MKPLFFLLVFLFPFHPARAFVAMDTSTAPAAKHYIYTIKECDALNDSSLVKDCRAQFPPSGKFENPNEHLTIEDVDSVPVQSKPMQRRSVPRRIGDPMRSTELPEIPKTPGDELVSAGTHWLISIGLGFGALAFGALNDWNIHGSTKVLMYGLYAGSLGFQIAVPIDLIAAGHEMNTKK